MLPPILKTQLKEYNENILLESKISLNLHQASFFPYVLMITGVFKISSGP